MRRRQRGEQALGIMELATIIIIRWINLCLIIKSVPKIRHITLLSAVC
jgi:hypothetical protein